MNNHHNATTASSTLFVQLDDGGTSDTTTRSSPNKEDTETTTSNTPVSSPGYSLLLLLPNNDDKERNQTNRTNASEVRWLSEPLPHLVSPPNCSQQPVMEEQSTAGAGGVASVTPTANVSVSEVEHPNATASVPDAARLSSFLLLLPVSTACGDEEAPKDSTMRVVKPVPEKEARDSLQRVSHTSTTVPVTNQAFSSSLSLSTVARSLPAPPPHPPHELRTIQSSYSESSSSNCYVMLSPLSEQPGKYGPGDTTTTVTRPIPGRPWCCGCGCGGGNVTWVSLLMLRWSQLLPCCGKGMVLALVSLSAALILGFTLPPPQVPNLHVAFIGNSMMYYNDLPRLMESISSGHITQNSCLHGDANLRNILITGNGMYNLWTTGSARVATNDGTVVFDYGACTVAQLLFGYDAALDDKLNNNHFQADNYVYNDDFTNFHDGKNPCLQSETYYQYLQAQYEAKGVPQYDYVIINDNTRSPSRKATRTAILEVLSYYWVPMLQQSGAVPVLIATYGYSTPYRDMGGLGTVAEFTSLTYEGYLEYAQVLQDNLPDTQQPRIAPVGIAFLMVWEENFSLWERLFHVDQIHTSPMGSYLQAIVIYHTLYGKLPDPTIALRSDMSYLWLRARRFQPSEHRRSPFPTIQEAEYLYEIANRVCNKGQVPQSFIRYHNQEAADYLPQDDLYRIDDLF